MGLRDRGTDNTFLTERQFANQATPLEVSDGRTLSSGGYFEIKYLWQLFCFPSRGGVGWLDSKQNRFTKSNHCCICPIMLLAEGLYRYLLPALTQAFNRWGCDATRCKEEWDKALADPAVPKLVDSQGFPTMPMLDTFHFKAWRKLSHDRVGAEEQTRNDVAPEDVVSLVARSALV